MADGLVLTGSLKFTDNSVLLLNEQWSDTITVAGDAAMNEIISLATTAAGVAVAIPSSIGTPGYARFENLDPTNYSEVGIQHSGTTFVGFLKLKPGEVSGPVRLAMASNALYARSNTAATLLKVTVIED